MVRLPLRVAPWWLRKLPEQTARTLPSLIHDLHVARAAGNYQEAINNYCKAAEYLLTAIKYEKNPVTLKTIREKCAEYATRAETLKKGLENPKPKGARAGGAGDADDKDDDSGDDDVEAPLLTEEQLATAEKEMNDELSKCALTLQRSTLFFAAQAQHARGAAHTRTRAHAHTRAVHTLTRVRCYVCTPWQACRHGVGEGEHAQALQAAFA
jgi:hypothetical protein